MSRICVHGILFIVFGALLPRNLRSEFSPSRLERTQVLTTWSTKACVTSLKGDDTLYHVF